MTSRGAASSAPRTPAGRPSSRAVSNERVDELLEQAKTSDDRAPLYTEVEQILYEEMPVIPIYHYAGVYMNDTDLGGWPVDNVEQNWYSKNLYKIAE
mgnify:CR=1 FL=1